MVTKCHYEQFLSPIATFSQFLHRSFPLTHLLTTICLPVCLSLYLSFSLRLLLSIHPWQTVIDTRAAGESSIQPCSNPNTQRYPTKWPPPNISRASKLHCVFSIFFFLSTLSLSLSLHPSLYLSLSHTPFFPLVIPVWHIKRSLEQLCFPPRCSSVGGRVTVSSFTTWSWL